YEHWIGTFYPEGISAQDFLSFYVKRFETVEVNNSFYRLPEKKTFEMWRDATPPGFIFAVKASRFITHMKKLKDPEQSLATFMERVQGLGGKLGPILFQLPPNWNRNIERLESFLSALPEGYRFAFEFRDPSWFHSDVYRALKKHGAAFCISEFAGLRTPGELTTDFTYIRLHGPEYAYGGLYSIEALSGWARTMSGWAARGIASYCYFDNDEAGYAARNASELRQTVSQIQTT
ncbi:MAG: DUF72 domain-containing protein, partial [Chloroflexi bacterium]|nr:DUF72 domain-containing protein [Chloroflexota bacterium]